MKRELLESYYTVTRLRKIEEQASSDATVHWTAPVWKLDAMNLNGRIYPTELARRIVEEGRTTVAYDGHGLASGEFAQAKAVCRNPRIEGAELWVDILMLDPAYSAKLQRMEELGVPVGVSSVGWGNCRSDGVVEPDSYELVRYLDFVLNPSGEVYATPVEPKKNEEGNQEPETSGPGAETTVEAMRDLETYKKIHAYVMERSE